jgi:hypothetical protein
MERMANESYSHIKAFLASFPGGIKPLRVCMEHRLASHHHTKVIHLFVIKHGSFVVFMRASSLKVFNLFFSFLADFKTPEKEILASFCRCSKLQTNVLFT